MNIKRVLKEKISNIIFPYRRITSSDYYKRPNCRILMYHSIEYSDSEQDALGLAVSPPLFYEQMKYLKDNGFKVIGLLDLVNLIERNRPAPPRAIVVTFDDGYKSILTNAAPILQKLGFSATLFASVSFIKKEIPDNLYWHDWPTLSWEELKQLSEAGISVGSHAFTHTRLGAKSEKELKYEISQSKELIQECIRHGISTFSYPHGSFNESVKKALKECGFRCACTSIEGVNNKDSDLFSLKRTEITAFDDTQFKFKKKLLGCYDWLELVRKRYD